MTTTIPAKTKKTQVNGGAIDFDTDILKVLLIVAGSGAPSVATTGVHFVGDVTATNAECAGAGYARQTLSGVTVADDADTVHIDFSFSNITFAQNAAGIDASSSATAARYAVFFKQVTNDTDSPVFAIADLVSGRGTINGDLILSAPAAGLIQW